MPGFLFLSSEDNKIDFITRQSVASFLHSLSAFIDMFSNSLHVQGEPRKHDDWLSWRELHRK